MEPCRRRPTWQRPCCLELHSKQQLINKLDVINAKALQKCNETLFGALAQSWAGSGLDTQTRNARLVRSHDCAACFPQHIPESVSTRCWVKARPSGAACWTARAGDRGEPSGRSACQPPCADGPSTCRAELAMARWLTKTFAAVPTRAGAGILARIPDARPTVSRTRSTDMDAHQTTPSRACETAAVCSLGSSRRRRPDPCARCPS